MLVYKQGRGGWHAYGGFDLCDRIQHKQFQVAPVAMSNNHMINVCTCNSIIILCLYFISNIFKVEQCYHANLKISWICRQSQKRSNRFKDKKVLLLTQKPQQFSTSKLYLLIVF